VGQLCGGLSHSGVRVTPRESLVAFSWLAGLGRGPADGGLGDERAVF
jgi:hypothetical protein